MPFVADSHLNREVAGQPDDWAAVVTRLDEVASALPRRGVRLAVVGCGTSYFMAQSYAWLRESGDTGRRMRSPPARTGWSAHTSTSSP